MTWIQKAIVFLGWSGIAFAAFVVVFVAWTMWRAIRDAHKRQR